LQASYSIGNDFKIQQVFTYKSSIMRSSITTVFFFVACVALLASSCRKRDAALPDNLVNFEFANQGLTADESSVTLKLKLSRGTDRDIPVVINLQPEGVEYGTDFKTTPEAISNRISLTIPSGNNEVSFKISKVPGALFDGDEKVLFDIYSSASPVMIGINKQFTLSFAELVATSANTVIDGGGPTYPYKVFVDLSANRQTPVGRTAWDLGFYNGADDHRVILNSSLAMMAKQIPKNDLTQVTAVDTIGFSTEVSFQSIPTVASLAYVDYPTGDLARTAIASVSATATDNKVYIVNRGRTGVTNWKKIRIIRNAGGGYTLQHADIGSASFTSVDISKDENHFFKYVSFETGAVSVEPQKTKWDIAWTYFVNTTNFGTGEVPYLFQDIILQNRNVEVAKVTTTTSSFADFDEADLGPLVFNRSQTTIGADWRAGGGPGVLPSVRTDRFYVIKDGDNNIYKLRFTAITLNQERGYPAYEIILVKKG
jgi:hypothetical protein